MATFSLCCFARPSIREAAGNVRLGEAIVGPLPLPINQYRVEQCRLDNAFSLAVDGSAQWWLLRIEGPFRVTWPDGTARRFESERQPSAWGPAIDVLLHMTVADANVSAEGTLEVTFVEGARLEVEPS